MRKLIIIFIILAVATASCTSSKYVTKCNGQRGVRVPMGVL